MTKPDYEAVGKARFEELMAAFKVAPLKQLIAGIRGLFDGAEGELIYLKKGDTLALADRLQVEGSGWSRTEYAEALDSLKE